MSSFKEVAMKTLFIAILFLAAILSPHLNVKAEADLDEAFYKQCIEKRIALCKENAKFRNSDRKNLKEYGEKKYNEAVFYQENKEKLAKTMALRKIPNKPHKICHFLVKQYCEKQ